MGLSLTVNHPPPRSRAHHRTAHPTTTNAVSFGFFLTIFFYVDLYWLGPYMLTKYRRDQYLEDWELVAAMLLWGCVLHLAFLFPTDRSIDGSTLLPSLASHALTQRNETKQTQTPPTRTNTATGSSSTLPRTARNSSPSPGAAAVRTNGTKDVPPALLARSLARLSFTHAPSSKHTPSIESKPRAHHRGALLHHAEPQLPRGGHDLLGLRPPDQEPPRLGRPRAFRRRHLRAQHGAYVHIFLLRVLGCFLLLGLGRRMSILYPHRHRHRH